MTQATVKQRLGKKGAFDSAEQEVALGVMYVADRIENQFGRLFREYGLTPSQYNVLRILRGEGRPLPALEVAGRMIQVVPAITGLVDRLEKQGLVARRRCEEDRRVIHIEITKKAMGVLAKIDRPLNELHKQLLGGMGKKDLLAMKGLLDKAADLLPAE